MIRHLAAAAFAAGILAATPPAQAQDAYIGTLETFAFNYCPRGWLPADGSILRIQDNTTLFALVGTAFGGDGVRTFALPDLRGRAMIGSGQNPRGGGYQVGAAGGEEVVTLNADQLPSHNHTAYIAAGSAAASSTDASGATLGTADIFTPGGSPSIAMARGTVETDFTGNSFPHPNMPPYLTVTTCIRSDAHGGIFPSRN